jgi:hypothetical protein
VQLNVLSVYLNFQNFVWALGWSGRSGLESAAVQRVEENCTCIFSVLWDYGILFIFVCLVTMLSLVNLSVVELIVCPQLIVKFFMILLNIFFAVGKWGI